MKSARGTIIYIGKAKNLKNRLSSYFQKNQLSEKSLALGTNEKCLRPVFWRLAKPAQPTHFGHPCQVPKCHQTGAVLP